MVASEVTRKLVDRSSDMLFEELRSLEHRLEDGYSKIDHERLSGRDVARWEARWFKLLRDYEALYDRIAA